MIVGGSFDVPADDCVEAYDPGGSALSGEPVPVPGVGGQISLRLNSDWLNQGLYAAWRSGILCQEPG